MAEDVTERRDQECVLDRALRSELVALTRVVKSFRKAYFKALRTLYEDHQRRRRRLLQSFMHLAYQDLLGPWAGMWVRYRAADVIRFWRLHAKPI
jgi:hypothetical protein